MHIILFPGGIHFSGQVRDLRRLLATLGQSRLTLAEFLRRSVH